MDGHKIHKNQGIQVISRAADILRLLGDEPGGLSLGQIAQKVGLPRSTVQRIVSALADEGFISTEMGSGGIRLGPAIQSLAQATSSDSRAKIKPVMERISRDTGETVDLALLDGGRMLFVDQVIGSQRLRTVSSIGESFPLTTTANGKAALACMDRQAAEDLIVQELNGAKHRHKKAGAVLAEIESIRRGSIATDEDEHTEGISAVGLAVQDQGGAIFALSVPVPSFRFAKVRAKLSPMIASYKAELTAASNPSG